MPRGEPVFPACPGTAWRLVGEKGMRGGEMGARLSSSSRRGGSRPPRDGSRHSQNAAVPQHPLPGMPRAPLPVHSPATAAAPNPRRRRRLHARALRLRYQRGVREREGRTEPRGRLRGVRNAPVGRGALRVGPSSTPVREGPSFAPRRQGLLGTVRGPDGTRKCRAGVRVSQA